MLATLTPLQTALVTACAMAVACALLSVVVVLRRWAFIGEGIAHAGFGGAATAWALALLPSAAALASHQAVYAMAAAFAVATALGIGYVTRNQQLRTDTAIGIFLVGSLAWGFTAYGIYTHVRQGQTPPDWEQYVLGHMTQLSAAYMLSAVGIAAIVALIVLGLLKEILCYCFDPVLASVSGVRAGLVHYLLIALVAVTIVAGMRLMGSLLVTALLVLPGATALLWSRRIGMVLGTAVGVGLMAAVIGTLMADRWRFIPEGPAIVMVLLAQFAVAYGARSVPRRARE